MPISSPLDISGCVLWLDASTISGLSDGDPVSTWEDGSSAGNDLTAAGGVRPTWQTNELDGKAVVRFDGTDDVMVAGSSGTYKHFFALVKLADATFNDYDALLTGTTSGIILIGDGGGGQTKWYDDGISTTYHLDGTSLAESNMTAPMQVWGRCSISYSSAWSITVQMGFDRNTGTMRYLSGDVAEVIAYDSVLSSSDRADVEAYLGAKWLGEEGGAVEQDHAGSCTPTGSLTKTVTKSLAGSSTASGALTKLVTQPLSGSSTATGTITRTTAKGVSGSTTSTGSAAKLVTKPSAGSSTPSGAESHIKVALQSLGGSLTPTGTITSATSKSLSGSSTPTGSITSLSTKPLSGSLTPSGAESHLKTALQSLSGSLTPSGIATLLSLKGLVGSLTPSGSLTSTGGSPSISVAAVIRFSAAFDKVRVYDALFGRVRTHSAAFQHVISQEGKF